MLQGAFPLKYRQRAQITLTSKGSSKQNQGVHTRYVLMNQAGPENYKLISEEPP